MRTTSRTILTAGVALLPLLLTAACGKSPDDAADKEDGQPSQTATQSFNVVLTDAGDRKIQVIKIVREATNLGLKDAKDLVDGAPMTVKEGLTREEAEKLKKEFEEAGAAVKINSSESRIEQTEASTPSSDDGFTPLVESPSLDNWTEIASQGAWSLEDGILKCNGQKDGYAWLATNDKYADFILELQWRVPADGNTGIFLRAPDYEGRTSMKAFEIQIRDDSKDDDLTDTSGAVFRRIPASGKYARPVGRWNDYRITMKGRRLTILLNGHTVSDTDIDTVAPQEGDPPMKDVPDQGHIGLQNHGQKADFKNIRIKEL